MGVSAFLLVIIAGLVPFAIIALVVVGIGVQWVAWQPPLLWSDRGVPSGSIKGPSGVTALSITSGEEYVAGFANFTITSGISFSVNHESSFLAKYDSAGHAVWTRVISSNASTYEPRYVPHDPVSGIAATASEVFAVAYSNGSYFIMGYDYNGNRLWATSFGPSNIEPETISASTSGVYVVGEMFQNGTITPQLVQKYDFSGRLIWTHAMNQTLSIAGLIADPSGVYLLTSVNLTRYDSNGGRIWDIPLYARGIAEDSTGLYVALTNGEIRKYATNGSELWEVSYQDSAYQTVQSQSMSAGNSGIYLYQQGDYSNDRLLKYDSDGHQVWNFGLKSLGGGWLGGGPYLSAGDDGLYLAGSSGRAGFVEKVAASPSFIFLGINPPWSFLTLGGTAGLIVTGLITWMSRLKKEMRRRPKTVRPREVSGVPLD